MVSAHSNTVVKTDQDLADLFSKANKQPFKDLKRKKKRRDK